MLILSIVLLMLVSAGVIGKIAIDRVSESGREVLKESEEIEAIQKMGLVIQRLIMPPNDYLVHGRKREYGYFEGLLQKNKKHLAACKKRVSAPRETQLLHEVGGSLEEINKLALKIFSLEDPIGNEEGAKLMEDMDAIADMSISKIDDVLAEARKEKMEYVAESKKVEIKSERVILVVISVMLAGILTWGFSFVRSITRPVGELIALTEKVAEGDLTARMHDLSNDEIGTLARSFNRMARRLYETTVSIEDLKKEMAARKKAEIEAQEAVAIKTQFISMVSHELRTPLTAIKESINIVFEGVGSDSIEQSKNFLGIAKRSVDRLARLIDDVLNFHKLELGKVDFNIEENDINKAVREIKEMMQPVAIEKGLKFIIDLDENIPKIKFDKDKIIQVMSNLVNNSIKFTEDGSVTVTTAVEGDNTVRVSVKDTGCGISEENIPKLFQKFEQFGDGNGRKTGGTGLGLSISREIIMKHKGKIWAESTWGEGATFHFVLPIREKRG